MRGTISLFSTIVVLMAGVLGPDEVCAQDTDVSPVVTMRQLWDAYNDLDFDSVERLGLDFVRNNAGQTPSELVQAYTLLALVTFSRQDEESAARYLQSALQLDPGLTLDPLLASPKMLAFFSEQKAAAASLAERVPTTATELRYITVHDPRPGAALRSIVLPGWGQFHRGDRPRGIALSTVWVTAVGATVILQRNRRDARVRYEREIDVRLIEDRYQSYNRIHKQRNLAAALAAAVWTVSLFDSLITFDQAPGQPYLQLSAVPSAIEPRVSLRLSMPVSR